QEVLLRRVRRRHGPYPASRQRGGRPCFLRPDRLHGPYARRRPVRRFLQRACARGDDGPDRRRQQPDGRHDRRLRGGCFPGQRLSPFANCINCTAALFSPGGGFCTAGGAGGGAFPGRRFCFSLAGKGAGRTIFVNSGATLAEPACRVYNRTTYGDSGGNCIMPRKEGQKQKLLVLLEILIRETDEKHPLSVPQLVEKLNERGIEAERKSVYGDLNTLNNLPGTPFEIVQLRGRGGGYYMTETLF